MKPPPQPKGKGGVTDADFFQELLDRVANLERDVANLKLEASREAAASTSYTDPFRDRDFSKPVRIPVFTEPEKKRHGSGTVARGRKALND